MPRIGFPIPSGRKERICPENDEFRWSGTIYCNIIVSGFGEESGGIIRIAEG